MNSVGHVFNVPNAKDFEHVENVLHERFATRNVAHALQRPAS